MNTMKVLLPILLTILACNWCVGLRILGIFPLHGKSHWVVGERVMLSLAERGHQVDVITHFLQKNPPPNYKEISIDGIIESSVNNMNASFLGHLGNRNMRYFVYMAGNKACDLMRHPNMQKLIENPPKDPPYDLVITELFTSPCYLAFGRYFNVPVVGLIASSFHEWLSDVTGNPQNPSFVPSLFSPYNQHMTFTQRLMNTFLTNMITVQINYYTAKQNTYVKKYLNIDVPIMDLYEDVAMILVNSHHTLNGIRPTTTGVIEVGGLHVNEKSDPLSPEVKKWLDESTHGCIFFTFGSMMRIETFDKPLLDTFYKVFAKIAPVRVLMKIAKKEELPPGLPKNVMTQTWFPQVTVFKHKNTKAFITHGGLMSTIEAIHFGIPMIGIPLFGDQPTNMMNAASKKVVVNLGSTDNVTEETLSYAIHTILNDQTYRDNMKKLSKTFKDRPMSAIDTAVYWVEYVARHGYVLRSPAVHLAWWQQRLLDVYAFVIACVAITLYIAIFLLRKLKNRLWKCKSCSKKENQSSDSKKKR